MFRLQQSVIIEQAFIQCINHLIEIFEITNILMIYGMAQISIKRIDYLFK